MITIRTDKDGDLDILTVEGHAEYAEYGKDIVCAAVSTLVLTLADALDDYGADMRKDADTVTLACRLWDDNARAAWDVVMRGLFLVAENYPENVKFIER